MVKFYGESMMRNSICIISKYHQILVHSKGDENNFTLENGKSHQLNEIDSTTSYYVKVNYKEMLQHPESPRYD